MAASNNASMLDKEFGEKEDSASTGSKENFSSTQNPAAEKNINPDSSEAHAQDARSRDLTNDAAPTPGEMEQGTSTPARKIHSVNNVASIPDGGLVAWVQVLGSFFLFFNSWGIINTFGVYQTVYETEILTSSTPSAISWIGSIQAFLLMIVGALTGPIYDAGYFRALLATGSIFIVFGHMMLSLIDRYWQALLAQAFCIGLGTGCLFVPSVAILSTYFRNNIALSMGLAASGSSLGGVIYPIMLHKLIPEVGFGWAVRIIGFTTLATLLVPNLCMKVRVLPASKRAIVDLTAFRSIPWVLFTIGSFIGFMGLYAPFFYIQLKAIQEHITTQNLAFYLLSILNSASIFGRILPNFVADKLGALNIIIPCALISGTLSLSLIATHSEASLVVLAILYGFFSGSFVSLPPTILVSLTPNRGLIGTRMGMCFGIISIGVLAGAPICGAILDANGFTAMWAFSGATIVVGGCIMATSRVAFVGWTVFQKA